MSTDPSFDSVAHTQGGLPHLLALLQTEFAKHMAAVNEQRLQKNLPALDMTGTLKAAEPFLKFGQKYLTENRPVQAFAVDMNYGILLSNNMRCSISPGVENLQGTMQDSPVVPISTGQNPNSGVIGI